MVQNCHYFYSNAVPKDGSLSTTASNFSTRLGNWTTMHELWLILYTALSLNICLCREFTARLFRIYPFAGTMENHFKFTYIWGETPPAFLMGTWRQFRERSVTARQRRYSVHKQLWFCLDCCQPWTNSAKCFSTTKWPLSPPFQPGTKPVSRTKAGTCRQDGSTQSLSWQGSADPPNTGLESSRAGSLTRTSPHVSSALFSAQRLSPIGVPPHCEGQCLPQEGSSQRWELPDMGRSEQALWGSVRPAKAASVGWRQGRWVPPAKLPTNLGQMDKRSNPVAHEGSEHQSEYFPAMGGLFHRSQK